MSARHRIAGLLALVAILSSPVTYLTSKMVLWVLFKLALALSLGAYWGLAYLKNRRGDLSSRPALYALVTAQWLVGSLVIGGSVVAYFQRHPVAFDLTNDSVYTLAPQTREVLQSLPSELELLGFYEEGRPERVLLKKLVEQLREVNSKITLKLIDPSRRSDLVKEHAVVGDGPRLLLRLGERSERLRRLDEAAVAGAMSALVADPRPIYLLIGHGERRLEGEHPRGFGRLGRELVAEGTQLAYLNLLDAGEVPSDARALLMVGPQKDFLVEERRLLRLYLDRGGRILLAADPGEAPDVELLFPGWGLALGPEQIVDAKLAGRSEPMALGAAYGEHPSVAAVAARGLHTLFFTARPALIGPSKPGVETVALVGTGRQAWAETEAAAGVWRRDPDEAIAPLVAVMALKSTKDTEGAHSEEARLVLFGDSDFLSNRGLNEGGNRQLALGLIGFLAGDNTALKLRAVERSVSRILLTQGERSVFQLVLLDLIPLFCLLPGLLIWQRRRGAA